MTGGMTMSLAYLFPEYYYQLPNLANLVKIDHPGQKNRTLDKNGLNLFHRAVKEGDKDKIAQMIALDKSYCKAFKEIHKEHLGKPESIVILRGFEKNFSISPMYSAVSGGKNSVIAFLDAVYQEFPNLNKESINNTLLNMPCKYYGFFHQTPIQAAVQKKDSDLVNSLLDMGAKTDYSFLLAHTPITLSTKRLNVENNLLVTAAISSNPETLKVLVKHPSKSKSWKNLDDAMAVAIVSNRFDNALALLELGANPNKKFSYHDFYNPRAFGRARVPSYIEYIANPKNNIPLETRETFIKTLIDKGAKVNSSRVLYYAVSLKSENLAKLFLNNGANIWAKKSLLHTTPYKFAKNEYLKDKMNTALLNIVKLYHEKELQVSTTKSNSCCCFGSIFNKNSNTELVMN